jgi:hypothetical protein
MARTIEEIQAGIIADAQAQDELTTVTSNTSKRAVWRLWTFVVAAAILLVEQLIDLFTAETEAKIASAIPSTEAWLVKKVFEFQYSATNPQIVQLVDLVPVYPVTDTTLRITSRTSVVTTLSNQVRIKVAKEEPPVSFTIDEITALQDYIKIIGVPGITYLVQSGNADKLYIKGNIYFKGQYSAVIADSVETAIASYLATLSAVDFDGVLKISDLENVIRSVTGVVDVVLVDVKARRDADAFSDGTFLVQSQTLISRQWQTVAGYIVEEDTAGDTFADSLTYIPS